MARKLCGVGWRSKAFDLTCRLSVIFDEVRPPLKDEGGRREGGTHTKSHTQYTGPIKSSGERQQASGLSEVTPERDCRNKKRGY